MSDMGPPETPTHRRRSAGEPVPPICRRCIPYLGNDHDTHSCDVVEFGMFAKKCTRCAGVRKDCLKPDEELFPWISDAYKARAALARTVRRAGAEPDEDEQGEIDAARTAADAACTELLRRLKLCDQKNRNKRTGSEATPKRARGAGASAAQSNLVDSVSLQRIARSLRAKVEIDLLTQPLTGEEKERVLRILGRDAHDGSPSPEPEESGEEDEDMEL